MRLFSTLDANVKKKFVGSKTILLNMYNLISIFKNSNLETSFPDGMVICVVDFVNSTNAFAYRICIAAVIKIGT